MVRMLALVRRYMGGLQCFSCVAARNYTFPAVSGDQRIPEFLLPPPPDNLCNPLFTAVVPFNRLEIDQLGRRGHRSVICCVVAAVFEMQLASSGEALQNEISVPPLSDR